MLKYNKSVVQNTLENKVITFTNYANQFATEHIFPYISIALKIWSTYIAKQNKNLLNYKNTNTEVVVYMLIICETLIS